MTDGDDICDHPAAEFKIDDITFGGGVKGGISIGVVGRCGVCGVDLTIMGVVKHGR